MPAGDTYLDREMFSDGSGCWIWRVVWQGRLYRAGICTSLEYATAAAEGCYLGLLARRQPGRLVVHPRETIPWCVDFDRVGLADQDDDEESAYWADQERRNERAEAAWGDIEPQAE